MFLILVLSVDLGFVWSTRASAKSKCAGPCARYRKSLYLLRSPYSSIDSLPAWAICACSQSFKITLWIRQRYPFSHWDHLLVSVPWSYQIFSVNVVVRCWLILFHVFCQASVQSLRDFHVGRQVSAFCPLPTCSKHRFISIQSQATQGFWTYHGLKGSASHSYGNFRPSNFTQRQRLFSTLRKIRHVSWLHWAWPEWFANSGEQSLHFQLTHHSVTGYHQFLILVMIRLSIAAKDVYGVPWLPMIFHRSHWWQQT